MPVQCCFHWHDPNDPKIWERIKAERLVRILLPHCSKPTRRDWEKNVSETLMATVWARRADDGEALELPADVPPSFDLSDPTSLRADGNGPENTGTLKGWEWAGICYVSNGFGMTPYVHFALFRAWRSEAESIGKDALAWIFKQLKCPAVLGWTPACFKHVEPLLRAWGFKDLAVIPQGFPFVDKEGGNLYFRDGVLRIRKK